MNGVNKGDDRKRKFMAVALELFYEKGYEKTTINDIINRMGVSKGAFYHYFKSKEDVIETISEEYARRGINMIKQVAERKDLNALEKINKALEKIMIYKKRSNDDRIKIKGIFKNEDNLKLEKKILDKIKDNVIPIYKNIIDQGIEEKLFNIPNSSELPEFFIHTMNSLDKSIDELLYRAYEENMTKEDLTKRLEEKLSVYEAMIERLFNIKNGSIMLKQPYMDAFVK